MGAVEVRPFEDADADEVAQLCLDNDWRSLQEPATVRAVCAAPGASAYVADDSGRVVGWAQALGDGVLQSHLSFLLVAPSHRRRGIARLLTVATFQATATLRMDLVTDMPHPFYETFSRRRMAGYRIYPGA